jgi:thioredoxin 1
MARIPTIDNDSFEEEVLQAHLPVLVDFGAKWCHPCEQLDPIIEELAEDWSDRVKFFKLDIDMALEITMKYGVMGVPSLILFVGGEPVKYLTGLVPKKRIVEEFGPIIGH